MAGHCWLCQFAGGQETTRIAIFMVEHAGEMSPDQMAQVIHDALEEVAPGAQGISRADVLAHITSHSLQPAVRLSIILRNLVGILDKLALAVVTSDDDGNLVVDSKNVALYLKVANEIREFYRMSDVNKLLFADAERIQSSRAPKLGEL